MFAYATTSTVFSVHPNHIFRLFLALNELLNVRRILTTQECSEVAERGFQQWRDHLVLILAIKPVEAVKEAIEVMKLYCLDTQRLHGKLLHNYMFVYCTCMFAIQYRYLSCSCMCLYRDVCGCMSSTLEPLYI